MINGKMSDGETNNRETGLKGEQESLYILP